MFRFVEKEKAIKNNKYKKKLKKKNTKKDIRSEQNL